MLAKRETADLLNPLTYDTVLQYLDGSDPFAFAGQWSFKDSFIYGAVFSSDDFIDWEKGQVNFDTEEFINLLEIAMRLPDHSETAHFSFGDEYLRLRNGEQLLLSLFLSGTNQFRIVKEYIGDIVAIGEPTSIGGRNIIITPREIGIYAKSPNQDAAWSFIRQMLLPETEIESHFFGGVGIPLRIDKFEDQIAELMIQEFWEEDLPNIDVVAGDIKPYTFIYDGLHEISMYAMTEEEAQEIRSIIESAAVGNRSDDSIFWILAEEYHAFLEGIRSAADTARIIQNRVQTYLNEQG